MIEWSKTSYAPSRAAKILSEHRVRPEWVTVLIFEMQRSKRVAAQGRMRRVGGFFRFVAEMLRDGRRKGALRKDVELFVDRTSTPRPAAIE